MMIAVSIALLPVAASIAVSSKATAAVPTATTVEDCDHHRDNPPDTSKKTGDGCDSMAGCALKCFNITPIVFSTIAISTSPYATIEPMRLQNNLVSQIGTPPFRPPRA